jgi:hypothetical protein
VIEAFIAPRVIVFQPTADTRAFVRVQRYHDLSSSSRAQPVSDCRCGATLETTLVHLGKPLVSRSKRVAPQDAAGWLSLVMQTDGLAMIVDLRDLSIAAVSDALRALLSDGPEQTVLGAHVYDFMANPPSGGLGMMAQGVIEGYEAQNSLKLPRHGPRPINGWMRVIGEERPARYGLMVLRVQGETRSGRRASPEPELRIRVHPKA